MCLVAHHLASLIQIYHLATKSIEEDLDFVLILGIEFENYVPWKLH